MAASLVFRGGFDPVSGELVMRSDGEEYIVIGNYWESVEGVGGEGDSPAHAAELAKADYKERMGV